MAQEVTGFLHIRTCKDPAHAILQTLQAMLRHPSGSRNQERETQAWAIPHPWYPREPTLQSQGLSRVVKPTYFFISSSSSHPGRKYAYLGELRKEVTCGVLVLHLKDI